MVAIDGYRRFPLIDQDPHAGRVVRYMRPSDYAAWAAVTAGLPGGLMLFRTSHPWYKSHYHLTSIFLSISVDIHQNAPIPSKHQWARQ
jgi:hypothetical protein